MYLRNCQVQCKVIDECMQYISIYLKLKGKQDYWYYLGVHSWRVIKLSKGMNKVWVTPEGEEYDEREDEEQRAFTGTKQQLCYLTI